MNFHVLIEFSNGRKKQVMLKRITFLNHIAGMVIDQKATRPDVDTEQQFPDKYSF